MPLPKNATHIAESLSSYFASHGMTKRIEQGGIVNEWAGLVGPQLANVCTPVSVDQSGTLWVRVQTSAWMQELQLMSPVIIKELARRGHRVTQIRWASGSADGEDLKRGDSPNRGRYYRRDR